MQQRENACRRVFIAYSHAIPYRDSQRAQKRSGDWTDFSGPDRRTLPGLEGTGS